MQTATSIPFGKFLENVSPPENIVADAEARCKKILELLASSEDVAVKEIVPTGSIFRDTALRNISDADVLVAVDFRRHSSPSPKDALEMIRTSLKGYNAQIVKKNGQAVTLYFKTWPHVDIVPAKRVNDTFGNLLYYEIPDMQRGTWIRTNPKNHDAAMSRLTKADKELIQMIKTWNHAHSGYLQSFHIETVLLHLRRNRHPGTVFTPPGSERTWDILSYFVALGESLGLSQYWYAQPAASLRTSIFNPRFVHPNNGSSSVTDYLGGNDMDEVISRVRAGFELARDAWTASYQGHDDAEAARLYKQLFGDTFPTSM